jgi:hypothetical protein
MIKKFMVISLIVLTFMIFILSVTEIIPIQLGFLSLLSLWLGVKLFGKYLHVKPKQSPGEYISVAGDKPPYATVYRREGDNYIKIKGPSKKYPVVTLCGSTKFKDEFIKVQRVLSLKGYIVISVGLFGHSDGEFNTVITDEIKELLDDVHKAKIDLSDEIFVVDVGGYVGTSTANEIRYAIETSKTVRYLSEEDII